MNEKDMSKKELEQQLSSCEVRISEIRGHERASEVSSELEGIEDQVKPAVWNSTRCRRTSTVGPRRRPRRSRR